MHPTLIIVITAAADVPLFLSRETRMSSADNRNASLFMVIGMAGFAINDAFMKQVLGTLDLSQAIALRGLVACVFVSVAAYWTGAFKAWRRNVSPLFFLRLCLETVTTYSFLSALKVMPVGDANAILMVTPLAVTLGAAIFFGERVGWRRYLAIIFGFGGVLLIVQPGDGDFHSGYSFALLTVCFMVSRDLITRRLPSDMPSLFVAFGSATSITLVAVAISATSTKLFDPVSASDMGWLAGAAFFIFLGYVFVIRATRVGEFGAVAPFRYTGLVFAIALGWIMFGDFPSDLVILGSGIVVVSGLYSLNREKKRVEAAR